MEGGSAVRSFGTGLLVAFSLYSAIPVPQVNWEKRTLRWAMSFLPLIGLLIGGLELGWLALCIRLRASAVFYAVLAALIPLVVSGGIHLDGLCDTCDALCSFGDRDKRLAILKDPHVGAFGPMWLMAFLLAEAACFAQLYEHPAAAPVMALGFAFSRCLGGRKIVSVPCAKDTGLAYLFSEGSDKLAVARTMAVELVLLGAALLGWCLADGGDAVYTAAVYLVLLLVWSVLHRRLCMSTFGGITGDLAGFYISTAELLALGCAAFGGLLL